MTDIEICQLSLGMLGKGGFTSFDDDTDEARACKAFYAPVRDAVLEDRIWTFATKQIRLDPVVDTPLFQYSKAFQIPADVVRVHRVDDGSGNFRISWEKQGDKILANEDAVFVVAVVKTVEPALFSPNFCIAVALRLAMMLCTPLTENRVLKTDLWAEYKDFIKEAGGTDGSQGKAERIRSDFFARRRG